LRLSPLRGAESPLTRENKSLTWSKQYPDPYSYERRRAIELATMCLERVNGRLYAYPRIWAKAG